MPIIQYKNAQYRLLRKTITIITVVQLIAVATTVATIVHWHRVLIVCAVP